LYVTSFDIGFSACSVYTMNEFTYLFIAYTLHTKHLISKLATYKGRPKYRYPDKTHNFILY